LPGKSAGNTPLAGKTGIGKFTAFKEEELVPLVRMVSKPAGKAVNGIIPVFFLLPVLRIFLPFLLFLLLLFTFAYFAVRQVTHELDNRLLVTLRLASEGEGNGLIEFRLVTEEPVDSSCDSSALTANVTVTVKLDDRIDVSSTGISYLLAEVLNDSDDFVLVIEVFINLFLVYTLAGNRVN